MKGYIYSIINKQNGKRYVGQTLHYDIRKKKHLNELRKNKHHSSKLQRAWNKYGEDSFEFEVREIEISKIQELYTIEQEEIKKYDSFFNGYNMTIGGEGIVRKNFTFEQYCFIYYGNTTFEGMMTTTAKFFDVDKTVVSDIVNQRTYPEYAELLTTISEEEKGQYIQNFIDTFGIDINNPPKIKNKQKVDYEILVNCRCIMEYHKNLGRPLERLLGYSNGTMSALYLGKRYKTALDKFNSLTEEEKKERADYWYKEFKIDEFLNNDYSDRKIDCNTRLISEDSLFLCYAGQELGYKYGYVADVFGYNQATVKDWFNGRARRKSKEKYLGLPEEKREEYKNRFKQLIE